MALKKEHFDFARKLISDMALAELERLVVECKHLHSNPRAMSAAIRRLRKEWGWLMPFSNDDIVNLTRWMITYVPQEIDRKNQNG